MRKNTTMKTTLRRLLRAISLYTARILTGIRGILTPRQSSDLEPSRPCDLGLRCPAVRPMVSHSADVTHRGARFAASVSTRRCPISPLTTKPSMAVEEIHCPNVDPDSRSRTHGSALEPPGEATGLGCIPRSPAWRGGHPDRGSRHQSRHPATALSDGSRERPPVSRRTGEARRATTPCFLLLLPATANVARRRRLRQGPGRCAQSPARTRTYGKRRGGAWRSTRW